MISVLIPVFNYQVTELVHQVSSQLSIQGIPFEIIVIDDGSVYSFKELNRVIAYGPNIKYIESAQNKGRIAARNELLKKAAYDWLLFLDADSVIIDNKFIASYLNHLNSHYQVIVGGRVYSTEKPQKCQLRLHWTYGTKREAQLAQQRLKNPYAGFMSNNFIIRKEVFQKIHLTEALQGYGHEDTWMGIQLERINAAVFHIDNPVRHDGVEDSKNFLDKTHHALQNLCRLKAIEGDKALKDHVKLFAAYCRYKKLGILPFLNLAISSMHPIIRKRLISCRPSLFLFDLYRLHYFARLDNAKRLQDANK